MYEEIFDSQTMDKTTFMNQMKARLEGYKEENEAYLKDHPSVTFLQGSDTPRYYSMADEKKMEGCNTVSFIAQCEDGASLGEGSFNWKENGAQGNHLEWPKSKDFAMSHSPVLEDDGSKELIRQQKELSDQVNALRSEISSNDTQLRSLLDRINQAKRYKNYPLAEKLQTQYDALSKDNTLLKEQLGHTEINSLRLAMPWMSTIRI